MRELLVGDFDKMAESVVREYLDNNVSLEDGLAKISMVEGLNPDQIQNLVQLANSLAHLTLFDRKDDGDKIVEFSPADPDAVLKKVYTDEVPEPEPCPEMDAPESRCSDMFGDFPDLTSKIRAALGGGGEEETVVSPEGDAVTKTVTKSSPGQRSMMVIKIRKVAEEVGQRKIAAAIQYREVLDGLAAEFAKLYGPDYSDFEKRALALRGDKAIPVLQDVRRCLKKDILVQVDNTKTAVLVDDASKDIQDLDKLIKLSERYQDCVDGEEYLQKEAGRWL